MSNIVLGSKSFLQQLIDTYYVNYKNMPFLLSIYDQKLNLCFTTEYVKNFYKHKHFYENDSGELPNDLVTPTLETNRRIATRWHSMALSISSNSIVTVVHFDRLGDKFCALHSTFTPILNPDQEVCGLVSQSYDFTSLFFGCSNWVNSKVKPNLNILTKKQQDVLYLLALDFNQDETAKLLKVTRGTISKVFSRILHKFGFEAHSDSWFQIINRQYVLENLKIPQVDIPLNVISIVANNAFTPAANN